MNHTDIFADEVEKALLDLAKDEQPLNVVMDKAQAMTLITTVQFCATSPIKNALKDLSIYTAKRLEKLFYENDEVLQDVIEAGWQRSLPKFPVETLIETMEKVGRQEIKFVMSKMEAWALMAIIQMAARHPDYAQTPAANSCTKLIIPIIEKVVTSNLLRAVADSGWDERFDRTSPTT